MIPRLSRSLPERLARIDEQCCEQVLRQWPSGCFDALCHDWCSIARLAQLPPEGNWFLWLILAGRGFGKTRAGAEWVRAIAEDDGAARIALVGASLQEARAIMVEGESGLLAIAAEDERPRWYPARRQLRWRSGALATIYGAADPEMLRGPQHSHAWADEISKWPRGVEAWDNLLFGLRLGTHPQIVATTTPRPVPLVRRLANDPATAITRGSTLENEALPERFRREMTRSFGGTRLGRQELDGVLLLDLEGALWNRDLLERCRWRQASPPAPEEMQRIVVGVDPPAGTQGDACGIVVAGLVDENRAIVLEDASCTGASPHGWAQAVAAAAARWQADRIVAEANNGGAMVGAVLRAADLSLPLRLVNATRGKVARAEPVAAAYEAGRVWHHGLFAALEDELCGLLANGRYEGPGRSPDRADAMVWALTELLFGPKRHLGVRRL